jgi:hypothetical protein
MRRILVVTPLKGGVTGNYVKAIINLLAQKRPGIEFGHAILEGTAVHYARNKLTMYAIQQKYDDLVFWDADLDVLGAFDRLISHKVPIVAGLYTKRALDTYFHVCAWDNKANDNQVGDGLVRVQQMAVGFSRLDLKVIKKYMDDHPERWGVMHDGGDNPEKMFDLFPFEKVGPSMPESRMNKVKAILDDVVLSAQEKVAKIELATWEEHKELPQFQGEDYGFCRLMREAGIPMYIDAKMILPHETTVKVPIPTAQLLKMINEPWRADELKELTK